MEKVTKKRPGLLLRLAFLAVAACFSLAASGQVTIRKSSISVEDAFASVRKQTGVIVFYENKNVDKKLKLSLDLNDVTLEKALDDICGKAGLQYEKKDHYIIIKRSGYMADGINGGRVTGHVADENGEPMVGATVLVLGKKTGTMTDANGNYSVKASRGDKLRFSFIGMESIERQVGNSSVINVAFAAHSNQLAEVEVVSDGYQNLPKDRATGSFSTVTAKELKQVPVPNVVQRLEGKIAGMKVDLFAGDRSFDYSGTLQSMNSSTRTLGVNDYNFSIRGVNTLTGEKMPLIVVDGVISEMDISRLSPDDIDNITVLKDAAAASIWGSRAANGVIVITTKKGKTGEKPKVSVSMSWMTQDKPDLNYLNRMSSAEVLDYQKELVDKGYLYDMGTPTTYYTAGYYYPEGVRLALDLKNGTITQSDYDSRVAELSSIDNSSQIADYFMQRATSQQYNLSVSGGGNNSTYYYSASYAKENPYAKRNSGQRLTLNLNNSWKLFNWATLTTTFQGTFLTYKNNGLALNTFYGSGSRSLMPYESLVDADGNGVDFDIYNPAWTSTLGEGRIPWTYNYLQELQLGNDKQNTNQFSGNINLNIPIYAGISSSTTFAMERGYTRATKWYDTESYYVRNIYNYYTPAGATSNSLGIRNGGLFKQTSDDKNWTFRQQFNFDHTFNGVHRVNALAGLELRETNIEQGSYTLWGYNRENGLTDTQLSYSSSLYPYATITGSNSSFYYGGDPTIGDRKRRFLSYYANAAYTFMERYNVSASVRYDDYNNFGLDKKYRATPFYSFGAKWHMSREKFMENVKWVNMLAMRLTYGINGNISLSTYPFTKLYYTTNYTTNQPSVGISAMANPALRWEKTYTTNLGVDFSLLANRLGGSIDYYHKRSRDLLYSFPFSASIIGNTSNGSLTRNAAAINSDGVDFNLNGVAYRDKDWNVNIGFNLAWNKNKVESNPYFKEEQYTTYYNYYPQGIGLVAGYSTDKMLAFQYAGLDETGQPLVYDENGETVKASESITSIKALKNVGHSTPTVFGGFNLNIRYKQFTLYSMFTYQAGSKFFKPVMSSYVTSPYNMRWSLTDDIADRWREPGDEGKTIVPGITSDYIALGRYRYSDANVEKGDYIRWRQVSLSYSLDDATARKLHIGGASLALSVSNLGLIWKANNAGIDPDYAYGLNNVSMPPKKAYTLSLNVNF